MRSSFNTYLAKVMTVNATTGVCTVVIPSVTGSRSLTVLNNLPETLSSGYDVPVVGSEQFVQANDEFSTIMWAVFVGQPAAVQEHPLPYDVGEIREYASVACVPPRFVQCDGGELDRIVYADLFEKIGTSWGAGNGTTTFNKPDYRNRTSVGSGDLYSPGDTGGSKDAVVVQHNHAVDNNVAIAGGSHGHSDTIAANQSGHRHSPFNYGSGTETNLVRLSSFDGSTAYVPHDSSKTATAPAGYTNMAVGYGQSEQLTDPSISISGGVDTDTTHAHTVSGSTLDDGVVGTDLNMQPYGALVKAIYTGVL